MEFQAQLFADLSHIHGYRWMCRGAAKRLRQGKPVPDEAPELAPGMDRSDVAAWEQTMLVCDQVGRHLRAVGAGLAWRVFNYDHSEILALIQRTVRSARAEHRRWPNATGIGAKPRQG